MVKFGLLVNPEPFTVVRLEMERIDGRPLRDFSHQARFRVGVEKLLKTWEQEGFVHGDLSPSNLLITPQGTIWAIDWVVDLQTHEGTPAYASRDVFRGRHTPDSDREAVRKIFALAKASPKG